MASIKKNYFFNLINTISGIVFPLITFPYASRILEADGIGIVNFFNTIISYISLVTCLGIPLYATREIAKVKHDPELLSKKSNEILFLHIFLTIVGYLIVAVLCITVEKIRDDLPLFLILSASIFFTTMGCDWFFRGTEDFKYITIRGLIFRLVYIPFLFIFVKTKQDLLIYGILTVGVTVGNNVFNFYRLSKLIRIKEITDAVKKPFLHIKGALEIFLLDASASIYLQLSVIILGFISTNASVGYYTAASRVITVIAGFITALQTTLLPRISSLIAKSDNETLNRTLENVISFIFCIGFPITAGLFIMAPVIIELFAGSDFIPSIPTLQILCFNIVISVFNGVVAIGILVPLNKERIATYACLIGAGMNVILSFILVPFIQQNGTAIAILGTEIVVCISLMVLGRKYISIDLWKPAYFKYIINMLVMWIICTLLYNLNNHLAYHLTVIPIVGIIIYTLGLFFLKDKFFFIFLDYLKSYKSRYSI